MSELDETYTEGIEKEGETFLDGLQNKKNLGKLEKEYSQKVKEIRRIYERSLRKELKNEKENLSVRSKANLDIKEVKAFKVENLDLEDNWVEKKKVDITSSGYKVKRKIKNLLYKITPNYILYLYYKTKRNLKDLSKERKDFLRRKKDKLIDLIMNFFSFIKDNYLGIKSWIKKIFSSLIKRDKKEQKEKNKEDGTKNSEKKGE